MNGNVTESLPVWHPGFSHRTKDDHMPEATNAIKNN